MSKSLPWSDEELSVLKTSYSTHTNAELSSMLRRSISAINTKGCEIGLKKSEETTSRAKRERYDKPLEILNQLDIKDVPIKIAFKHRNWLARQYYENELSTLDIATLTGCTRKNIEYWMKKYDLPRRDDVERYTERCLMKISDTSKGRSPFSKGLTKYDHPGIMRISEKLSGELSYAWKGGTPVNSGGYRCVTAKSHPKADRDGYVLEHRLVVEEHLGRILESHEVVHHRDHNRLNNDIANLYLFPSNVAHLTYHNHKWHRNPNITEEQFMEEVFSYGRSN